ncbi:MAG: rRNA maturation RNase YbeY [Bacteroidetes bacterium]|nr:MAG: rRNA maturation RNase YbeY [Bacteroidota bacterium]
MLPINFFLEDIQYRVRNKILLRKWIFDTIIAEGFDLEGISFIYCSDKFLLNLNIEYLNHDTFTDVITFQYNEGLERLHSDIFISIDRMRENANIFKQRQLDEFHRIMIHGVLHLLGYEDKTKVKKEEMTAKENYYLSLRPTKLIKY